MRYFTASRAYESEIAEKIAFRTASKGRRVVPAALAKTNKLKKLTHEK